MPYAKSIAESEKLVVGDQRERRLEAVRLRRRVSLFKRVGMVAREAANNSIRIERAVSAEDLRAAYKLVHDVFVFQKYITPQNSGMRIRIYEALPEMATFVAKVDDQVVGVMSLVPDSAELGLPSDRVFGKELGRLRKMGRRVSEVTNLAVAEEYCKSSVLLELSRCICAHAVNSGVDDMFIAISPGHSAFFETILQFDAWGEARNYGHDVVDMVEGKRLDVNAIADRAASADKLLGKDAFLYDWFVANNPEYLRTAAAATWADRAFRHAAVLKSLFGAGGELLRQCTPDQLRVLRRRWGEAIFESVFGHGGAVAASFVAPVICQAAMAISAA